MAEWDKTEYMMKRLGDNIHVTKDGILYRRLYKGMNIERPVIDRDTPIDGGISLGEVPREAIIVDYETSPLLQDLYEDSKKRASQEGTVKKGRVLMAVFDSVKDAMPEQDRKAVLEMLRIHGVDPKKEDIVNLNVFLRKGIGYCVPDALACGVMLERFRDEGHINGNPSIDRNYLPHLVARNGGHAWCRYSNSGSKSYILDVAKGFLGEPGDERAPWPYWRPGEEPPGTN